MFLDLIYSRILDQEKTKAGWETQMSSRIEQVERGKTGQTNVRKGMRDSLGKGAAKR